jgi:hypothetical protein
MDFISGGGFLMRHYSLCLAIRQVRRMLYAAAAGAQELLWRHKRLIWIFLPFPSPLASQEFRRIGFLLRRV